MISLNGILLSKEVIKLNHVNFFVFSIFVSFLALTLSSHINSNIISKLCLNNFNMELELASTFGSPKVTNSTMRITIEICLANVFNIPQ